MVTESNRVALSHIKRAIEEGRGVSTNVKVDALFSLNIISERLAALEAEKAERDRIIGECAQAVGALVSPECSDEFRAMLPAEIKRQLDTLKKACEIFEKNSAACAEEFEGRLAAERERDALRAKLAQYEQAPTVQRCPATDLTIMRPARKEGE